MWPTKRIWDNLCNEQTLTCKSKMDGRYANFWTVVSPTVDYKSIHSKIVRQKKNNLFLCQQIQSDFKDTGIYWVNYWQLDIENAIKKINKCDTNTLPQRYYHQLTGPEHKGPWVSLSCVMGGVIILLETNTGGATIE